MNIFMILLSVGFVLLLGIMNKSLLKSTIKITGYLGLGSLFVVTCSSCQHKIAPWKSVPNQFLGIEPTKVSGNEVQNDIANLVMNLYLPGFKSKEALKYYDENFIFEDPSIIVKGKDGMEILIDQINRMEIVNHYRDISFFGNNILIEVDNEQRQKFIKMRIRHLVYLELNDERNKILAQKDMWEGAPFLFWCGVCPRVKKILGYTLKLLYK